MGALYQARNEVKDAIQYYLKSISLNDNSEVSHFNLGLCYSCIDEIKKGIVHFEKVLKLSPQGDIAEKARDQIRVQNMPKCEDCFYLFNFAEIEDYNTKVKAKARGIPNDLCICSIRFERHNTGAWNSPYWEGGNPLAYLIRNSEVGLKQVSCKDFENKHTCRGTNYYKDIVQQIIIGNNNIIGNHNSQRF